MRRPASWAVAGSVMAALVVAVAIRQSRPPAVSPSSPPAMETAKSNRPHKTARIPNPVEPGAKPSETLELRSAREEKKALRDVARSDEKIAAPAKIGKPPSRQTRLLRRLLWLPRRLRLV